MSPQALEAALAETNAQFDLNSRNVIGLADAGVPARIIDVMIALSYPRKFVVEKSAGSASAPFLPPAFLAADPFDYRAYYYSPFAYMYLGVLLSVCVWLFVCGGRGRPLRDSAPERRRPGNRWGRIHTCTPARIRARARRPPLQEPPRAAQRGQRLRAAAGRFRPPDTARAGRRRLPDPAGAAPEETIQDARRFRADGHTRRIPEDLFGVPTLLTYQPDAQRGVLIADIDLTEATGLLAKRHKPI